MKIWQAHIIKERDELHAKILVNVQSVPNPTMADICQYVGELYHMTSYLRYLDQEIESWDK